MIDGLRVWDTHTHIGEALHSGRRQTAADLAQSMDAVGVDRSLAIPFPVVADYKAAHDEIAAAGRAHPGRIQGCICLDPFVPRDAYLDEVRRCVEVHGFRAIKLQPQYQPLNPISARSDFFYEAASLYGLTVIIHTGAGSPFALPSLYIKPARKFPSVSIILAHAGGGIYVQEAIVAAEVCPNIYIELSSLMPHHVREVLSYVDSSRLLIGSDLIESTRSEIGKIVELDVARGVKENLLWNTAERLFV